MEVKRWFENGYIKKPSLFVYKESSLYTLFEEFPKKKDKFLLISFSDALGTLIKNLMKKKSCRRKGKFTVAHLFFLIKDL
jgi:hypothetical protein